MAPAYSRTCFHVRPRGNTYCHNQRMPPDVTNPGPPLSSSLLPFHTETLPTRHLLLRSRHLLLATVLLSSACSSPQRKSAPVAAQPSPAVVRTVRETVTVRDTVAERRAARLEFRLFESEAQLEALQSRLNDTRDEVVRTMAKLRRAASRAEAASGMAEAEVALQSLKSSAGQRQLPEVSEATRLVQQSSVEFNKQNFGGALYLATQAKTVAGSGRSRVDPGNRGASLPGETPFAVPVRLKVASRGNVRAGPGISFAVAFTVETGTVLTGHSHTDEWIKISDDGGRNGWIFRTLVARP